MSFSFADNFSTLETLRDSCRSDSFPASASFAQFVEGIDEEEEDEDEAHVPAHHPTHRRSYSLSRPPYQQRTSIVVDLVDTVSVPTAPTSVSTQSSYNSSSHLTVTATNQLARAMSEGAAPLHSNHFTHALADPSLSTEHLMIALTSLLAEMCDRNDKLYLSMPIRSITKFHSADRPQITIRDYTTRIRHYSTCSDACFVLAVIYMDRIQCRSFIVDSLNIHRLLVTCIMIASKFLDDRCQVNSIYAQIGGISNLELNQLEIELLNILDFQLDVDNELYFMYTQALASRAQAEISRHLLSPPAPMRSLHRDPACAEMDPSPIMQIRSLRPDASCPSVVQFNANQTQSEGQAPTPTATEAMTTNEAPMTNGNEAVNQAMGFHPVECNNNSNPQMSFSAREFHAPSVPAPCPVYPNTQQQQPASTQHHPQQQFPANFFSVPSDVEYSVSCSSNSSSTSPQDFLSWVQSSPSTPTSFVSRSTSEDFGGSNSGWFACGQASVPDQAQAVSGAAYVCGAVSVPLCTVFAQNGTTISVVNTHIASYPVPEAGPTHYPVFYPTQPPPQHQQFPAHWTNNSCNNSAPTSIMGFGEHLECTDALMT